jgi:hypothetical protein
VHYLKDMSISFLKVLLCFIMFYYVYYVVLLCFIMFYYVLSPVLLCFIMFWHLRPVAMVEASL